jgi:capsule biosynthesis phosphatase
MRIVIDLDGTLCSIRKHDETYADVSPINEAIEAVRKLKGDGHTIIIYTARHMKTCNANTGLVVARIGRITLEWLERYGVPYDEIYFGKPWGDLYIDDGACLPNWPEILKKAGKEK